MAVLTKGCLKSTLLALTVTGGLCILLGHYGDGGGAHLHPRTNSMNGVCNDGVCSEYLSPMEVGMLNRCNKQGGHTMGSCHFVNGTSRQPVALASFPGSGNTWVRGLLEKVTGVCTGSIYSDCSLRLNGFHGEGIESGSVLVVKTHGNARLGPRNTFGSAVLIVRNPRDALVSEWNRKATHNADRHVFVAGAEYFGNNSHWNTFVQVFGKNWGSMIHRWCVYGRRHPLHIVHYEDIKLNKLEEVKKMVEFLGFPFSATELSQRLKEDYSAFYRKHSRQDMSRDFNYFTPEQLQFVLRVIGDTQNSLIDEGLQDVCTLERYLA